MKKPTMPARKPMPMPKKANLSAAQATRIRAKANRMMGCK